jgi:hypothetical protein
MKMPKYKKTVQVASAQSAKDKGEIQLRPEIHPLAYSQARAFANLARALAQGMDDSFNDGERLAYQVNAGLSIELYLKALMIAARGGRVTKGHNLAELYRDFPPFLTEFLEFTYSSRTPVGGWTIPLKAFRFSASPTPPEGPDVSLAPQFGTFAAAMRTSNNAFVRARYFFEQVTDNNWAIFEYAPGPLDAAMHALDAAYQHLLAGSFGAGKDMINEPTS